MGTGSVQPVENSPASRKSGKQPTTLTLRDTVDIVNMALWHFRKAGGQVRIGNSTTHDMTAILALPALQVCKKCHNLNLFEDMAGQVCQKCAGTPFGE